MSNLTRELDLIPALQHQNDDLMHSVKQQDMQIDSQRSEIDDLKNVVRGPIRHNMGIQANDNSHNELAHAQNEIKQK